MPKSMPTGAAASTPRRAFTSPAAFAIAAILLVLQLVLSLAGGVLGLLLAFWLAGKGPELIDVLWTIYRSLSGAS